ncbi:tyrosine-protein phosphatase [Dactylosporangium sp. NBC_01737]|uniref:tyrosine-protein phosphatase n=1 Tax=Dactylosporangium sp. NBC_01737 TaxID=2975959 RepID=UPI002E162739|nr:tyrosine-protein phosphatase [Dactylosporangium sp. NBC_01737]
METERHLDWAGCVNARDLGGLPTGDGRTTRWGAVVRADNLDRLTPQGWAALAAHGVRTVVDLREDDERSTTVTRPAGIAVVHVPLDDNADAGFWSSLVDEDVDDATPLYYRPFIERKAERCVAAVTAVARAQPGGVVVHCGLGRDRTGLVSLLLLALAGATRDAIVADYTLSGERLRQRFTRAADTDPIAARLALQGLTIAEALHAVLNGLDVATHLRASGLTAGDLHAVRARLIAA